LVSSPVLISEKMEQRESGGAREKSQASEMSSTAFRSRRQAVVNPAAKF